MTTLAQSPNVLQEHGLADIRPRDSQERLNAMQAVHEGNFCVRLPHQWTELSGIIAKAS